MHLHEFIWLFLVCYSSWANDCSAALKVHFSVRKRRLVVAGGDDYCMDHNHEVSAEVFNQYPETKRRQVAPAIAKMTLMMEVNAVSSDIRDYVNAHFGTDLTTKDVHNIRYVR
jgi:hypothetical protein